MTWLKAINVFILQWFFVRLTRHNEKVITEFILKDISIMPDGLAGMGGAGKVSIHQWYSIQYWILPCSGWGNEFIYLNKRPKFIKYSKKRILTN
jgi:hypothetical protein